MQTNYGAEYDRLYHNHWWWRAREAILLREIRRLPVPAAAEVLDIGCGNALSFPVLSQFGSVRGIEVDEGLLDPAGRFRDRIDTRLLGDPIYAGRAYDLITALDVIEHIEDDRAAVGEMARMLKPGGHVLITVPAFMSLWDEHDVINHHFRRYTKSTLRAAMTDQGLEILRVRYVFRVLFVPKFIVRKLNQKKGKKIAQHNIPSGWVNAIMRTACTLEDAMLSRVPVPFGTSVMAVARKLPR